MSRQIHKLNIRPCRHDDRDAVVALWHACGLIVPQNDPVADIDLKLDFQPDLFLVGRQTDHLIATVMAGYEGHRGWINYLAVHPDFRRQGIGRQMVAAAEAKLRQLGCPKINLQVRRTNTGVIAFYRRLGFSVDAVVSLGKRLSKDEIVTIVDRHNRVIGSASRARMRREGLCHRATYVLVFDSHDRLFLHKRTALKDIYPGHYDVAAGGVVLAGETYDVSAERELAEELGIKNAPLEPLFDFYHEDGRCRVWGMVYKCVWNGPITLQAEEVESGQFRPLPAILEMCERKPFTPDGLYVLQRYLKL
jgi:ribosomal protein S18 acetylase RimI-like enzyme/8-oxo-dGTP pyrophosphatase MutT (NUDIX family)